MRGGMSTDPAFIAQRMKVKLQDAGLAIDVVLKWKVHAGGTLDPVTNATVGAVVTSQTSTVRGLVHFVQAGTFAVREFTEVETGDAILDLAPDVAIDGKKELIFEFNGAKWDRKPMSEKLAQHWDTVLGGVRITRSVLLRKLT